MQPQYYPENLHQDQDADGKELADIKENLIETGQAVIRAAWVMSRAHESMILSR